jgi:hypothetical protein
MSPDTRAAGAINFPDAPATVLLLASDLAAIPQEVQSLHEIVKEHEMRLDQYGEYIRELRFREEPEPKPIEKDRAKMLCAILASNNGKIFGDIKTLFLHHILFKVCGRFKMRR